jgi:hypothetical protein
MGVRMARKTIELARVAEGEMRKLFPHLPVWDFGRREIVWDPAAEVDNGEKS